MWRSGALTITELRLPEEALPFDTYEAIGAWLGTVKRSSSWWLGDWLAYGERTYSERAAQAATATGLAEQTLLNVAYVARRVPPSVRRVGVPFHLHAEVAPLKPREQAEWLDSVEKHDWTRAELREKMSAARGADGLLPPAVGDGSIPPAVVDLETSARELVRGAKRYGADYLVPRHTFAALCASLGEEWE